MRVPIAIADLVERVFLPRNPNKMRGADRRVVEAAHEFKKLVAAARAEEELGGPAPCYEPIEVTLEGSPDVWHEAVRFDPRDHGERQIPVFVVLSEDSLSPRSAPPERLLLSASHVVAWRHRGGAR